MALVSMRQLLDHAAEHGYGVPAFNINNLEQIQAIMQAAAEADSPVILQGFRRRAQIRRRTVPAPYGAGGGRAVPATSRSRCIRTTAPVRRCANDRFVPASPA